MESKTTKKLKTMKDIITDLMRDLNFNYMIHNLGIEPAKEEISKGMKFRLWFRKIGGDKNFTEDQISTAIANKFKN